MLTEAQKIVRLGRMTSSVVSGALGVNPHMTPIAAWEAIRGESLFAGNKATERGNLLEEPILQYPCEAMGLIRGPVNFVSIEDWAGDSVDATYYEDGRLVAIGEGKSVSLGAEKGWGEPGTDQVPPHVAIQCHWHLIHWPEAERCLVPVLVGGYDFKFEIYIVERDEEIEAHLWAQAKAWHEEYVIGNVRPPVNGGDTAWLKSRHPCNFRDELEFDASLDELCFQALEATENRKHFEKIEEDAKARVMDWLGDYGTHRGALTQVTWRNNKDSLKTDWEAVAMALGATPELIAAHSEMKQGTRVLKISQAKLKGKK